jgi:hypothetical protein
MGIAAAGSAKVTGHLFLLSPLPQALYIESVSALADPA